MTMEELVEKLTLDPKGISKTDVLYALKLTRTYLSRVAVEQEDRDNSYYASDALRKVNDVAWNINHIS